MPGAQHGQRTRFWTAPGTVDSVISYLQTHPPKGTRANGSDGGGGGGQPPTERDVLVVRHDRLTFDGNGPTARVVVDLAGCSGTTFRIGQRAPIQLSRTVDATVDEVDRVVLAAVGRPVTAASASWLTRRRSSPQRSAG